MSYTLIIEKRENNLADSYFYYCIPVIAVVCLHQLPGLHFRITTYQLRFPGLTTIRSDERITSAFGKERPTRKDLLY